MENYIYITDENNNEVAMEILFTFDYEDKHYVIVHEPNDQDNFYPFIYDEDGNLEVVEDEEEFNMILEVFESFEGIDNE